MGEQEEAYNRAVAIEGHLDVGPAGRPEARDQDLAWSNVPDSSPQLLFSVAV